jgi:hypothetical protein
MEHNQSKNNRRLFSANRLLLPLAILSILTLSLLFVDVFAVYALRSNSDSMSTIVEYETWANNRFNSELNRIIVANSQLSSMQTQLDSIQAQLASAQSEIKLYQNTYGEIESGDVHPTIGPDGQPITLVGNPSAVDPTFAQLESFLLSDKTDQNIYIPGIYVCSEFARDVYNNAEKAGIRAAFVGIRFNGISEGHALNAFMTTDKGLVFIDCTGLEALQSGPVDNDKIVTVKIGIDYQPVGLFPVDGQPVKFPDGGTIADVQLDW